MVCLPCETKSSMRIKDYVMIVRLQSKSYLARNLSQSKRSIVICRRKGRERKGREGQRKRGMREGGQETGWLEGRKARKGGRGRGREGGEKEGRDGVKYEVKKNNLIANKLNEATGSLSVLTGLKMKSMSIHHTQQIFNSNPLTNLLTYTLFSL